MSSGNNEVFIYIHNKDEVREVDFGEEGAAYADQPICKIQAAENNKFFMIGIPSKRAIGFFGLNRTQLNSKPLKWVTKVSELVLDCPNQVNSNILFVLQYAFENFYADDHLSTMMLIDERHRALDFQYILWRFDTSQLDTSELKFLDNGPGGADEQEEE